MDTFLLPYLVPEIGATQDIFTDKLPVVTEFEVLLDIKETCDAEVQTYLKISRLQHISDEHICKLNTMFVAGLDLMDSLETRYTLSILQLRILDHR